jgi:hypothetical protein
LREAAVEGAMILCVDVTRVSVITGRGSDKISIHTTEESPTPGVTKEPLCLDFVVQAGDGYRYVTEVLRIDDEYVEVINA